MKEKTGENAEELYKMLLELKADVNTAKEQTSDLKRQLDRIEGKQRKIIEELRG